MDGSGVFKCAHNTGIINVSDNILNDSGEACDVIKFKTSGEIG